MLEVQNCTYSINGKSLLRNVSLKLHPGQVTALLGPNGAGKSTLVKIMSGQLSPTAGSVCLKGSRLSDLTSVGLAKERAVLAQSRAVGFPFKAFDVALMGRHPHNVSGAESPADLQIVEACLARTDSDHLSQRIYNTLSGGEAARIDLARVLAQETDILLLDEPTNHLDPRHQVQVLKLCRELAAEGKAVAVCMHDLNLAAQYCTEILLLKNGEMVASGTPKEILTAELLQKVYDTAFVVWQRPGGGVCILPMDEAEVTTVRDDEFQVTASHDDLTKTRKEIPVDVYR